MTRVHPHYSPPKDHRVYPETFVFQTLSLQRTWPETDNDYILVTAGLTVARIYLVTLAGPRPAWHWVITGPAIPCEIYPHQGMAESLSDAEGMVRQKFNAWLSWALQRGHTALWHGADSRWLDSMRAYSHEPRPLTDTIYMERNHGS